MGRGRVLQQPRSGAVLAAVEPCPHGSVVEVRTGESSARIEVPFEADVAGALDLLGAMRRVDRATLTVDGDRITARAHGVGHRVPVSVSVPVSVALGLACVGVPVHLARVVL